VATEIPAAKIYDDGEGREKEQIGGSAGWNIVLEGGSMGTGEGGQWVDVLDVPTGDTLVIVDMMTVASHPLPPPFRSFPFPWASRLTMMDFRWKNDVTLALLLQLTAAIRLGRSAWTDPLGPIR